MIIIDDHHDDVANAKDLDAKQHARAEAIAKELTDFEQRMTCAERAVAIVGRRTSVGVAWFFWWFILDIEMKSWWEYSNHFKFTNL